MKADVEALPDDVEALKAALIAARAEAAAARAQQSDDQALIAHLKLQIEKLNRDRYGPRSERTARLLDQLELTLEELESAATEDELCRRNRGGQSRERNHHRGVVHAQAAVPPAVPGSSASRTDNCAGTCGVRLLWRIAAIQAWRGHHRDTGGHPKVLEGDPARPGEVLLPGLREDQPGTGAVPRDREGLGRTQPAGDGAVREVWPAPAAQPAGRALCQGGRAD